MPGNLLLSLEGTCSEISQILDDGLLFWILQNLKSLQLDVFICPFLILMYPYLLQTFSLCKSCMPLLSKPCLCIVNHIKREALVIEILQLSEVCHGTIPQFKLFSDYEGFIHAVAE